MGSHSRLLRSFGFRSRCFSQNKIWIRTMRDPTEQKAAQAIDTSVIFLCWLIMQTSVVGGHCNGVGVWTVREKLASRFHTLSNIHPYGLKIHHHSSTALIFLADPVGVPLSPTTIGSPSFHRRTIALAISLRSVFYAPRVFLLIVTDSASSTQGVYLG